MGIRGLWKLPDERDWLWVKLGLAQVGKAMLSKSLIQFSADGWGCVSFPVVWPEAKNLIQVFIEIHVILIFYIILFLYWRRQWQPTPVLLPGKSHGRRSLVGCSPWGRKESDKTEWLHFHFSLSGIGEGNGNPLQCSCLENPRDGGAWWTAVYGVAQSWTWLKRLSSSIFISRKCC